MAKVRDSMGFAISKALLQPNLVLFSVIVSFRLYGKNIVVLLACKSSRNERF
ncbi:hypothetical protein [Gillisia sp. Hel1_33_143]|uniref:hypothetical protein n=1 Tax=Gillisia sp. Hel1_33_143 TaxID=1336796 RepID=UPI0012FDF5B7|nr:hypothetical protein [Gillisia sp. Hel1_33_143]